MIPKPQTWSEGKQAEVILLQRFHRLRPTFDRTLAFLLQTARSKDDG